MATLKNRGKYNILGNRYGLLTVKEMITVKGRVCAVCICNCGNEKIIRRDVLMGRNILSCGCIKEQKLEERKMTRITRKESIKNKIIPCDYMMEKEPKQMVRLLMKTLKITEEQAELKYKAWRNDLRKGIERDIS